MSRPPERTPGKASTDRVPPKPTREAATAGRDADEVAGQRAEPTGANPPEELGTERQEVGDSASSSKHPPHVPDHDAGTEVQKEMLSPDDAPVLPANASGRDKFTPEEQQEEIRDTSMYDGRPERDKDRPPSQRGEENRG